jgi:hypothetical protein
MSVNPFYIACRETGSIRNDIPLWASSIENPMALNSESSQSVFREDLSSVPGGFQLHNVLSKLECNALIKASEALGYTDDAAQSLPRSVRHNDNLTWIADDTTLAILWDRCAGLFTDDHNHFIGRQALGLNGRCRFYRYNEGDYFSPHSDDSWPGSRIVNKEVVANAFDDRWSMYTFLIYLNDDFEGGETKFLVDAKEPDLPARDQQNSLAISLRAPTGSVLCFPHGAHPLQCLHGSEDIISGTKYIIRTDVLFEL